VDFPLNIFIHSFIHRVKVTNFFPYLCQPVFAAILWEKLLQMFVTLLSLKYAFSIMWTFFLSQMVKLYLNNTVNRHPLTPHITPSYTHPQNGKRIVAIDSVMSFQPTYTTLPRHPFNGLISRTTWVSWHIKVKPVWIYMRQEMMGFWDGSGISWTMCK